MKIESDLMVMERRGVTAKEIAAGTGLSMATVYRALKSLERKGLMIKIPPQRQTKEPGVSCRLA